MTFVSYAQNFEDVLLWRALKHIRAGFYIDAGAWHPDVDSVTRAFYDRGWSGINIEPTAADFHRLQAARLRDVNLNVALGAAAGSAEFHVVEGTGLSTLEAEAAAGYGRAVVTTRVAVQTLAAICRAHAPRDIHFLKIDVEGAERAALEGADFAAFRPWIVLLEATLPNSQIPNHAGWEPLLLAAGYRFAWFDGLNRFYVAEEHWEAMAPHFRLPVSVFDDFLRAADTEWARKIHVAETAAADWQSRGTNAETLLREVQRAGSQHLAELVQTRADLAATLARALAAEQAAQDAGAWLAAMRGSTSWRAMAPLRASLRLLARARRRAAPAMAAPVPAPTPEPAPPPSQPVLSPATAIIPPPPLPARPSGGHPLRAVHQFHSGSAVGDAITNAMLLIRRTLRAQGYASDIYVERRDPALAAELRTLDEMPAHGDYVLLLHHSMGHDAFAQVMALPAPKALMYHNITPTEFLDDAWLRDYAALGRAQLAAMRDHVGAALADSDFNALELRHLGFAPVATATLLFDVAALQARAESTPRAADGQPFTVLFVGRVCAAKGQADLVAAFAAFRAQFGAPCRLVLVGRHGGADDPTVQAITAGSAGLDGSVVLTGLVDDAALAGWYGAADLYVSLSHHEGFGVPLVEAMAHGVPVLAWPCGAVPYTLAGAGMELATREAEGVAAAMLALARDPARRAAMTERQRMALDRFALPRHAERLIEALVRAGAAPPEEPGLRAMLAQNMRFSVTGHVNGSYSLAVVNRTLARTIAAARPGHVRLLPVEGAPTADLSGVPEMERTAIQALADAAKSATGPEIVISQHYPVHVPTDPGDAALALFFWEESLVPRATVAVLEAGFAAVLAPSAFVAKALVDSGLSLPVATIGFAPDLVPWRALAARRTERMRAPGSAFTFLHVSSCFPRKGVDVLLAAYAQAFRAGDPVRLIVKGFPNPHNEVAGLIAALPPGHAEIVFENRDMDAAALGALYLAADAMVLPTRGEGFNLPAAEAMAAGIPLIVTGHGGQMEFCSPDTARLVAFRFAPSASHVAGTHSVWVEPDQDDLAAAMREMVAAVPGTAARHEIDERALRAVAAVETRLSPRRTMQRLTDAATDALLRPPAAPCRVAVVSTWNVRCGVAEYTRHLLEAMPDDGEIGHLTVLCDDRTEPTRGTGATGGTGADEGAAIGHVAAWQVGEAASMPRLAVAIARADPHAVMIQHQPGLIPWLGLAALLRTDALAGRVVTVTLHNTASLLDLPAGEQAEVVAALARATRVIVHPRADLDRMAAMGLAGTATLMPQGAPPARPPPPARALPPEAAPLIGCYGFFLPGKGIPELIAALARLRTRWPAARLRLVCAQYDLPESADEIAACRAAAGDAGLDDAIDWITDFLPTERSLELLAECDVVALPYQASKEASSAALRTALCAGVPMIVTPLALFAEADDAVARFAATDATALESGLASLLADLAARAGLQRAARAWLEAHAWPAIAWRTQGMLRGLVAQLRHRP